MSAFWILWCIFILIAAVIFLSVLPQVVDMSIPIIIGLGL